MDAHRQTWVNVRVGGDGALSRRGFLRLLGAGAAGLSWLDCLTLHADQMRKARKACIVLWMAGGPSQFETFDPKPGAATQGPTRAIPTSVPGVRIAEHWPRTAAALNDLAVIRSMTSTEGNHGRATYLLHTSYPPSGGIVHPGFGSLVAQQLGAADFDLPHFVSISGQTIGPSFLGVRYAPFVVTDPNQPPDNLLPPVGKERLTRRLSLLKELEAPLTRTGAARLVREHQPFYDRRGQMALSRWTTAFSLDPERRRTGDVYGCSGLG